MTLWPSIPFMPGVLASLTLSIVTDVSITRMMRDATTVPIALTLPKISKSRDLRAAARSCQRGVASDGTQFLRSKKRAVHPNPPRIETHFQPQRRWTDQQRANENRRRNRVVPTPAEISLVGEFMPLNRGTGFSRNALQTRPPRRERPRVQRLAPTPTAWARLREPREERPRRWRWG